MSRTKREVIDEFNEMSDQASRNGWRPRCKDNPAAYMDYDDEHVPTPEEAERLCWGCALRDLCFERAIANHEKYGVWGGMVFVNGKPQVARKKLAA